MPNDVAVSVVSGEIIKPRTLVDALQERIEQVKATEDAGICASCGQRKIEANRL